MREITIEPCNLWEYMEKKDKEGQLGAVMYEIAKNEEYGISVYASKDEKGRYCIVVEADEYEVFNEWVTDRDDAEVTCAKVYENYLTEKVIQVLSDVGGDEEDPDIEEEIRLREDELTNCTEEFLMEILGRDAYFDGVEFEMINDCKEHFIEYVARKYGLPIYRPMILEDENGEDFFEEYPYECMIFDDENNPIYK